LRYVDDRPKLESTLAISRLAAWDAPKDIRGAFEDMGVRLEIWVRVWHSIQVKES
jgi:hypothetical protein